MSEFDVSGSFKADRYLFSNYLSLAMPVEIYYRDGKIADGFFGGLRDKSTHLIIRRFSFRDSQQVEEVKAVAVSSLMYFLVKDIYNQPKSSLKKTSKSFTIDGANAAAQNLKSKLQEVVQQAAQNKAPASSNSFTPAPKPQI